MGFLRGGLMQTMLFVGVCLLLAPVVAFAADGSVLGIDMSTLISTLGSVVLALLGWLANSIRKKSEADSKKTRAETALLKLAAIATGMAVRAWNALSPVAQAAFANDGKWDDVERKQFEDKVQEILKDFASADDLKEICEALGIPLAGIVSKIAAMLIEKFAFAHDPEILSQSPLAFRVSKTEWKSGDLDYEPSAQGG